MPFCCQVAGGCLIEFDIIANYYKKIAMCWTKDPIYSWYNWPLKVSGWLDILSGSNEKMFAPRLVGDDCYWLLCTIDVTRTTLETKIWMTGVLNGLTCSSHSVETLHELKREVRLFSTAWCLLVSSPWKPMICFCCDKSIRERDRVESRVPGFLYIVTKLVLIVQYLHQWTLWQETKKNETNTTNEK